MSVADFNYTSTRNEIIQGAFEICQVIEPGQVLSGNQLQQGLRKLQRIVKSWISKGIHLWNLELIPVSTIADNPKLTTTVDQSIIGIDKAWVVSDSRELPLEVVSWSRYLDIQDKSATGRPQIVAYRRTLNSSSTAHEVYFWPTPDDIYTINLLGVYPLKDLENSGDTGGLPAEIQRALEYQLASDLFDSYPDSLSRQQFISGKANDLFQEALNFNNGIIESTSEIASLF